jgi:hypothetical protein
LLDELKRDLQFDRDRAHVEVVDGIESFMSIAVFGVRVLTLEVRLVA